MGLRQLYHHGMTKPTDRASLNAIIAFQDEAKTCQSLVELATVLDAAIRDFGFRWFNMLHVGNFTKADAPVLKVSTFPDGWKSELIESGMIFEGPMVAAARRSFAGFSWDRITDFITPNEHQLSMLKRGREFGLLQGYSLPIRMTGEPDGLFTVAQRSENLVTQGQAMAARLIGTIAFETGRSILGNKIKTERQISLSPRQIDCLELVAQGKSDWEIGQILGLSKDTVHEYVEGARKRYGVKRRTQIVLRAVRDGHLDIEALT